MIKPFYESLKELPIFVGFDDNKNPYGVDDVKGVSRDDSLKRRGSYEDIKKLNKQYIGIGLAAPVQVGEHYLVCLDFDWKRSKDLKPHPKQAELMHKLTNEGHAYEKSHSGNGCHFWVLMDKDKIPGSAKLGGGYEIEVFSGMAQGHSNVLVTDRELNGSLNVLGEIDLPKRAERIGKNSPPELTLMSRSEWMEVIIASKYDVDDYDEWLEIGMTLHYDSEGENSGLETWIDWSKQSLKFSESKAHEKWSGFKINDNSKGFKSIVWAARANGYSFPVRETAAQAIARDPYDRDGDGRINATQENLLKLLKLYQFRYDEFRATYMGVFDGIIRVLEEADYARIQLQAERLGFKRLPTTMIRENILMVCMDNKFDSAIEWGNSLKWDGISRCNKLLHRYFGAEDTPYAEAVSMYITSAMGGRLIEPGCKADAAVVLVGSQGVGKTVSINALSPMEDTFAEISFHSRDADLSRLLRGKLIGELAELRGLKSKEAEDIKAWMSRTTEEWTPKYMEFTKQFKRRLTFWGSTNDQQFLNDVTGNRRWLPINVSTPDPESLIVDREQIWAEAVDIFKNQGVLWKHAQELADGEREKYFDEDPLVDEVRNFLRATPEQEQFTGKEIWMGIHPGYPFNRQEQHKVKRAMVTLKWEHKVIKKNGKTFKGYVKTVKLP